MNMINFPSHKLIGFEICDFKDSVWPPRALTDYIITFYSSFNCLPTEMHWSWASTDVRALWDSECSVRLNDKDEWLKYTEENDADKFPDIKQTLNKNRTFWFIAPFSFNVEQHDAKLRLLLESLKFSRTLNYKIHTFHRFDLENEVDTIMSIKNFFATNQVLRGDLSIILLKPNAQFLTIYKLLTKYALSYCRVLKWEVYPRMSDEHFNALYPNSLRRPYGQAWYEYMTSQVVVALLVISPNVKALRNKCVSVRELSHMSWTKNVMHCSADPMEGTRDFKIFFPQVTMDELNRELSEMYDIKESRILQSEPVQEPEIAPQEQIFLEFLKFMDSFH
jgi:nucleoside diphosphate kinase